MSGVLKNLVNGLSREWTKLGKYWRVPNSASISEARQKLGSQVMSQLFERVARPLATNQTPGAFLGGLRVMAVDGTVLDVPDSKANARVFGYPASRPGTQAAFPKVRVVMLIEAGTHLIVDALMCPYRIGDLTFPVKSLLQAASPHRGRVILTNLATVPGYQLVFCFDVLGSRQDERYLRHTS